MTSVSLSRVDIEKLVRQLNEELAREVVQGEVYLTGGAVMYLVYQARPSTRNVDAFFIPTKQLRMAAARVVLKNNLPEAG